MSERVADSVGGGVSNWLLENDPVTFSSLLFVNPSSCSFLPLYFFFILLFFLLCMIRWQPRALRYCE
jgi:hypothetical protein